MTGTECIVLTQFGHWDLIFDLNVMLRHDNDKWDPTNARQLLRYSDDHGYNIACFQLGNEPNFMQHKFHRPLSGSRLAQDYQILKSVLHEFPRYQNSCILGPEVTKLTVPATRQYLEDWMDKLGLSAQHGIKHVIRHSFFYRLVTRTLKPNPTTDWEFYGQNGICLPLPITQRSFKGQDYAFGVFIVLNFVLFLVIGAGQALIFYNIHSSAMATMKGHRKQDTVIARRLFLIVCTDFCCWFPIGLMGLLASSGIPIPGVVNVLAAVFVLPINSALNPFLYTINALLERRAEKMEQKRMEKMMSRLHVELRSWPSDKVEELVKFCLSSNLVHKKRVLQEFGREYSPRPQATPTTEDLRRQTEDRIRAYKLIMERGEGLTETELKALEKLVQFCLSTSPAQTREFGPSISVGENSFGQQTVSVSEGLPTLPQSQTEAQIHVSQVILLERDEEVKVTSLDGEGSCEESQC
nr:hypothetical protein BaRGS_030078 [Batillaria attramentaria]